MELDWTTVIFELINFVVLALLLERFLFKPVRGMLVARKDEVASAFTEAQTARQHSELAQAEFERRQHELEAQTEALSVEAKAEAEQAAEQIMNDAREQLRRARESLDAELERARQAALHRLRPELIELTYEAGRHLLLDMHAGEIAVAFARRGARSLRDALRSGDEDEPDEAARQRRHVRAFVSPDADLHAVSRVLEEILGDADLELDVDDALVGGVKLIADGIEVEASAGASLARWLREQIPTPLSRSSSGAELGALP